MRSQDKEILVKVSEIELGDFDEEKCLVVNNLQNIGKYTTKERALEILDEIQEVLCPKILTMKPNSQITLNDGVNIVLPDNCSYERIGDTYVFEMPEEQE